MPNFRLGCVEPWDRMRAGLQRHPGCRAALEALGLAALAGLVWVVFLRPLGPQDLQDFTRAARSVLAGRDPYLPLHSAAFRTGHAFVYPYLVAWLYAPLGALGPVAAKVAYAVISLAAIVASCRALGHRGFLPAALVILSSTTIIGLQMGTINALLLIGLAVAWRWRDRVLVVGVAVGLVAVTKLFLVPLILWLVISRRYRATLAAGLTFVVVLVGGWTLGPLGPLDYVRMLVVLQAHESSHSWALVSLIRGLGLAARPAQAAAALVVGGLLAAAAVACRRGGAETIAFAAAVVASLLLSPIVWSSYVLILVAPLLAAATGELALAAYTAVSWVMVIPDGAGAGAIAVGAALVGMLAAAAVLAFRARRARQGAPWVPELPPLGWVAALAVVAEAGRTAFPATLGHMPATVIGLGVVAFAWQRSKWAPGTTPIAPSGP